MKKVLLFLLLGLLAASAVAGYFALQLFGKASLNKETVEVRIHSGWSLEQLAEVLNSKVGLKNKSEFVTWIKRLGYQKVRACTVAIPPSSSFYEMAKILKSNRYQTVNITILGSMDKHKLAKVLSNRIEVDSAKVITALTTATNIADAGFDSITWPALLIPNTYNFAVATNWEGFTKRMLQEYHKYWNEDRLAKAKKQGLTPIEVAIVASIVTKESNKTDEYVTIAGVYINRLRIGMLLQADPTVAFARGYDGRILAEDLLIPSPYNTYMFKGLPPGPLCIPNLSSIEAVLNYEKHDFIYFVANPDLNGRHHFSKTLAEHEHWANLYRTAARELRKKSRLKAQNLE